MISMKTSIGPIVFPTKLEWAAPPTGKSSHAPLRLRVLVLPHFYNVLQFHSDVLRESSVFTTWRSEEFKEGVGH